MRDVRSTPHPPTPEVARLLDALAGVRAAGGRAALATVVRVRGSAYRREGTRMLVRPDGTYECALSGGCLEPAVAAAAARVIATGDPVVVTYDLADDSVWSLNIGCSGAVDIRIERVDDDETTQAWLDVLARGEAAVRITPLAGASGQRIVRRSGASSGHLSRDLEPAADARAAAILAMPRPASLTASVAGAELFFEVSEPLPELFVFGAGHDAVPLVTQAAAAGFAVTVVDPRAAFLRTDLFSGARLVLAGFDALAAAVSLPAGAFALVMSHHLERDRQALEFCLRADLFYVGVLGPRARFEGLAADLEHAGGVPPAALARVHSPVGLSLGAETPEEVAVSIVAELVAVRRGFAGGFLRGTTASLHRPAASLSMARS